MSKVIEEFYNKIDLVPVLIQQNIESFDRNPDIAKEFEYWIENGHYNIQDCVEVEGYTAQSIANLSKFLIGESSFLLLIELRENPEKAKKKIQRGFKVK